MDSTDRLWATFWVSGFAVAIAIVLCLYSYSIASIPLTQKRIVSEHNLKMACISRNGTWGSTDNDGNPPYSCKMR
jgi:hypothetical protein